MFIKSNPNPYGRQTGDCTVRAICNATGRDWFDVYIELSIEGMLYGDMPSSNIVWSSYIQRIGFSKRVLIDEPGEYTVRHFCYDHPVGVYILGTGSHVICVDSGDYIDDWDSGDTIPLYYFRKER